jgi:spore germination protein GerM
VNIKHLLLGLIVVLFVGFGGGYFFGWYFQPQQLEVADERPVVDAAPVAEQEVQLFFAGRTDEPLVQESVLIAGCQDDVSCIQGLVGSLIAGSQQGNGPVLPPQTQLLGVVIENDLVRLDFSADLVNYHPGGSFSELQSIYSLANSLNLSFPYIRQIQILVEGQPRQTLKGHARIDQPVYADFTFDGQQRQDGQSGGLSIDRLIEEVIEEN